MTPYLDTFHAVPCIESLHRIGKSEFFLTEYCSFDMKPNLGSLLSLNNSINNLYYIGLTLKRGNSANFEIQKIFSLTLFRMGIFGAAHRWVGGPKRPPSLKSVTHILQWWNLAVVPSLKKIQKIYELRNTPTEFCWHQHFPSEISKFCYFKKYRYRLHFSIQFLIFFNFSWVFKDFFNKPSYNFDDVGKNGYPRPS